MNKKIIKLLIITIISLSMNITHTYAATKECYYLDSTTEKSAAAVTEYRYGIDWPWVTTEVRKTMTNGQPNNRKFTWGNAGDVASYYRDNFGVEIVDDGKNKCYQYLIFIPGQNVALTTDNKQIYEKYKNKGNALEMVTKEVYDDTPVKGTNNGTTPQKNEDLGCNIFGDANNPNSLRGLIKEILGYFQVIAVVIAISMGTVDIMKAVIAGKEDEMKKTQTTFVKRLVAVVLIFLIPIVLDIVMYLVEIASGNTMCELF